MSEAGALAITEDGFLGGRLRLKQPVDGHRAGHDAVLLAAATPAGPSERIVDFGAGVGAAGLAVALRIRGCEVMLLEQDAALVALARDNIAANGLSARAVTLDVTAPNAAFVEAGLPPGSADRVMMNPPFNASARHQPSPDSSRRAAHEADASTLERWVHAARRLLRPGGTLTLIWRADGLADVLAALDRGLGGLVILPVHARAEVPAHRILVRATKGSAAPTALLAGMVLNAGSGEPATETEAVLRGERLLPLATI